MQQNFLKRSLALFIFICFWISAFSIVSDSAKVVKSFSGTILVTNKGISTIPNFTLGKPATILNFYIGNKIRFEPEFRISLEGKPWMFIFWFRTDLAKSEKFTLRLGANPTVAFKSLPVTSNGVQKNLLASYRTLTADLTPTYSVTRNIGVGLYYMYVYGMEDITARNTHYVAFRTYFTNINISKEYFLKFTPQIYYLHQDGFSGTYLSSNQSLNRRNFPFSLAAMISRPIHTDILIGNKLVWNMSLIYSFNHSYIKNR